MRLCASLASGRGVSWEGVDVAEFELIINLLFGLLLLGSAVLCFLFPRQAQKWYSGRKRQESDLFSPSWIVIFFYRVVGALLFVAFLFFLLGVLYSE